MTKEEFCTVKIMQLYSHNYLYDSIDLVKENINEIIFYKLIENLQIAGIVYHLMQHGKIVNYSNNLFLLFEELYFKYCRQEDKVSKIVDEILISCYKNNIRCVIGGTYALGNAIVGYGDIFLDNVDVFIDRNIDISSFNINNCLINKRIENDKFFLNNYNLIKKFNFVNLDKIYKEIVVDYNEDNLNKEVVFAYLLYTVLSENQEKKLNNKLTTKINQIFSISSTI